MSFAVVRDILTSRLDEGDRGDRGWFVITRVHVAVSWLKGIAEYIETRGAGASVELTERDYKRIAAIIETDTMDPGVLLRRHHLLVMDKPLQLLRRIDEPYWREVELTANGRALALSDDPASVLEKVLTEVRFAAEPWCSGDRATLYGEFDLRVYEVTKRVVADCGGFIDRDEFDLFVSRIREISEIKWAVEAIALYRTLPLNEQAALHSEVKNRIPGDKAYQNWRDVGLHTFSVFSLGTSLVRDGTTLALTEKWTDVRTGAGAEAEAAAAPELRMPEPADSDALLSPPSAPASNDGSDAESFVAKVFRSQGWTVVFYTNRRGFGFDLWARKGDVAIVIEVKSSVGQLGSVTMTENEHRAAYEHGENYVLALVEELRSNTPVLRLVENPISKVEIVEYNTTTYTISRAEWLRAMTD